MRTYVEFPSFLPFFQTGLGSTDSTALDGEWVQLPSVSWNPLPHLRDWQLHQLPWPPWGLWHKSSQKRRAADTQNRSASWQSRQEMAMDVDPWTSNC